MNRLVLAMALLLSAQVLEADTLPGTGAGFAWQVTVPAGATDIELVLACFDCDYPDEATLRVDGGPPLVLFGVRDTGRDERVVPFTIPLSLTTGPHSLTFACARVANCIRIDAIDLTFTPAPESAWLKAAKGLEARGWVPAWLSAGDAVWVVTREDTEAPRVLACATDGETGARFATWVDAALEGLPDGPAPEATACELAWCFATGPGRAAEIRGACP